MNFSAFLISGVGYFLILFSLIFSVFFSLNSLRMKNLYTKSHFFGAIDNFCAPIFLFGIIFIIFGKLNHFGFVFNFFISGKIFFIGLFLALGSIASTHAICKVNFQTNQREQNKKTNDY